VQLVWQTATASAANASANASGRIEAEGLLATPRVVVAQREAVASFCGVRVRAARVGTYTLGARVQGAGHVLASSAPVQIIGHGRVLEIVRGVPARVDSDAPLRVDVVVRGPDGTPLRDQLVEASIEAALPDAAADAGRRGLSARNVTGELHPGSTLALSGPDGVARLTLWLRRWAAGGQFVVRARSLLAGDVLSAPFSVWAPVAAVEVLAVPEASPMQPAEWVWPLLRAKNISVCLPLPHAHPPPAPAVPVLTSSASIPAPAAAPVSNGATDGATVRADWLQQPGSIRRDQDSGA
jgi:hypothetical protein